MSLSLSVFLTLSGRESVRQFAREQKFSWKKVLFPMAVPGEHRTAAKSTRAKAVEVILIIQDQCGISLKRETLAKFAG